jgi:hypothetical protein
MYHDKQTLRFWTPTIFAPFGINKEYDKYVLKLELDDEMEGHSYLRKLILHIEKVIKKMIEDGKLEDALKDDEENDDILEERIKDDEENNTDDYFKSIIQKRFGKKKDLLRGRIKYTEIEFKQKEGNYLKTVFDLPKQCYVRVQLEIVGLWDYRKDNNRSGLNVNIKKIIVP